MAGPGGGPGHGDRGISLIAKSYRPISGRNNIVKVDPVKNNRVYGNSNIHIYLILKIDA